MYYMKAMMLTGIRQMKMMEVPEPKITSDHEVKIKMMVVGVCGSDIHYYQSGRIGSQVVKYPFPVGHEGAGLVVEVGSKVTKVKPGDHIAIEPAMPCGECDQCKSGRQHTCRKLRFLGCPGQAEGCLVETIVMPENNCYPIAQCMSFDEAAISEPLAIGVYAVKKSIPMPEARIGILGSGPIGMSVLLAARSQGCSKVYMTDKIDERLMVVKKAGAGWTGNVDKINIVETIHQQEPLMLDAVFECCGKQEALDQAFELLKPGGKIMIVGIPEFTKWTIPVDIARHKEIQIQNVRRQVNCVETALYNMAIGKIDVSLMATHRFNFEDTQKAFDLVADYQDGVMKAMIDFDK
jgi:L-iditol 2-dehydrogenase